MNRSKVAFQIISRITNIWQYQYWFNAQHPMMKHKQSTVEMHIAYMRELLTDIFHFNTYDEDGPCFHQHCGKLDVSKIYHYTLYQILSKRIFALIYNWTKKESVS